MRQKGEERVTRQRGTVTDWPECLPTNDGWHTTTEQTNVNSRERETGSLERERVFVCW